MPDVWHRQEPREVRPFFMSVKAEDALQNSRIRLFADGQTSIEPSYELDDIDFKRLALQIEPIVANPKEWLPDGIKTKDLKLVLIGRHSFLKRSDQLFEFAMDSGPVPVWDIEPDLLSRFGGGKNFQITLALCLSADRQWKPGAPFVQGHWISQKTFTLRSRAVPSLFDVRPRNDEDWVRAGFPAKTLFAVEYNGGIEVEPEEDSSVATVHIHADAHNKLVNSPLGASLQPLLGAEILLTILLESFSDWKDISQVEAASPLATLLKQLSKASPITLDELKAMAREPRKLRGLLQDRLSVIQQL